MSLCGWLAEREPDPSAEAALSEMREASKASRPATAEPGPQPVSMGGFTLYSDRPVGRSGGIVLAVDGEPGLAEPRLAELAARRGIADALAEAYRERGPGLLDVLRGAFALVAYDADEGRLLMAVDRFRTRPLCFARAGSAIVFASSATAVAAHPAVSPRLRPQGIFDYSYFHCVPGPGSIFAEVSKVEAASYVLAGPGGSWHSDRYWNPGFSEDDTPFPELRDAFVAALRGAVERCRPDGATGAFLSGGTDSSTVAGLLRRTAGRSVDTFSIGFSADGYDEIGYARIAAEHFGTVQHEYYVTPEDVSEALPAVAAAYDEPFGNSSAIPTLFCARLARENGCSRLLAGDGGDELFAGNERYATQTLFESYYRIPRALRRAAIEPLLVGTRLTEGLPLIRKARSYVQQARIPMPLRLERYNFLQRTPLAEVFAPEFLAEIDPVGPARALQAAYERPERASLLNRMLYLDWKFTLADNDLRKVSQMCDLAGVEVCYPMLDDALVDLSLRVPSRLKLRPRRLRYFFKRALSDFLPEPILTKPKHGFGLPFGLWLKTSPALQEQVYANLTALKGRGLYRPEFIDDLVETHRTGHSAYYGTMVWVLSMLEEWLRRHRMSL